MLRIVSEICILSGRTEKQQQKLSDDLADTREILGRTRTELHAIKELTETLYTIAQKLGSIVDAGGPASESFDILFHCTLKDLETQPESECEATPPEPAFTQALGNEKKEEEFKTHSVGGQTGCCIQIYYYESHPGLRHDALR